MRTLLVSLGLLASVASAQVVVQLPVPQIVFPAPPPVVVVQPGVQVVEDYDEEVFFVDNVYWVKRGPHWYRARDHRGGWVRVDAPPGALVRITPGRYRHYRGPKGPPPGHMKNGKRK